MDITDRSAQEQIHARVEEYLRISMNHAGEAIFVGIPMSLNFPKDRETDIKVWSQTINALQLMGISVTFSASDLWIRVIGENEDPFNAPPFRPSRLINPFSAL